ncbi:MAG: glucosaminidase domain-containing protein [Bilifractor sp.]
MEEMMEKQEFIEEIARYVRKYTPQYGIRVNSPIIAQAILESGWGESKLAKAYHNYFGLKCGTRWTGRSVNLRTKEEYFPGTLSSIRDNFRVYGSMEEGVRGYFEFIQLPRYQNLKGILDPEVYLEKIREDGYATSTSYVENNMRLIRQYGLTRFDEEEKEIMGRTAQDLLNVLRSWIGYSEANGKFRRIIDIYNSHRPLARGYRVQYTDEWCDTAVSAAAIQAGMADLIGTECGCEEHVKIFRRKGIWIEDGRIIPKPGYIILYNWNDSSQPNDGYSDHIGVVESVSEHAIIVIEGNNSGAVRRRQIPVGWGYIRGYAAPRYEATVKSGPKMSVEEAARGVLAGKYGNGEDRKRAVTALGLDYNTVQKRVNQILRAESRPRKSVDEVAREVIRGQLGNGAQRKRKLMEAGYDAAAVQRRVNILLRK